MSEKWAEYPHGLPRGFEFRGTFEPLPVVVKFDDGHTEDDWAKDCELMIYCEKSCRGLPYRPIAWREKYARNDLSRMLAESGRNERDRN